MGKDTLVDNLGRAERARVDSERMLHLARLSRWAAVGTVAGYLGIVIVSWPESSRPGLVAWFLVGVALAVARVFVTDQRHRVSGGPLQRERQTVLVAGAMGFLWSVWALFLPPFDDPGRLVAGMAIVGFIWFGSTLTLSVSRDAFVAYSLASVPIPVIRMLVEGGTVRWTVLAALPLAVVAIGLYRESRHRLLTSLQQLLRVEALHTEQQILFDAVAQGIFVTSNGRIVRCNRRFLDQVGYSEHDLVGRPLLELLADGPEVGAQLERIRQDRSEHPHREVTLVLPMVRSNGAEFFAELTGRPRLVADDDAGTVWVCSDITERREAESRLRILAERDPLTGLANRRVLLERLENLRETTPPARPGALLIDLDGFKAINDLHGHVTCDSVLAAMAGRLASTIDAESTVARIGGDEFVVLVPQADFPVLEAIAARVLVVLANPLSAEGHTLQISSSIGLAVADTPRGVADLLRRADRAMYAAKAAGGRTWRSDDAATVASGR